jgi:hypothetical protein
MISEAGSNQTASFIPTPGVVKAVWLTWDTKNIIVSTTERTSLQTAKKYQRHRVLLVFLKTKTHEVPWHSKINLLSASQRVRVPIQLSEPKYLPNVT